MKRKPPRDGPLVRIGTFVLIRIGLPLLALLVIILVEHLKTNANLHYEKTVTDTGIYLAEDEPVSVSKHNTVCLGKHAVVVCSLPESEGKKKGVYWYFQVKDIRTDAIFYIASDEELPAGQYKIDGLVSGYYYDENTRDRKPVCHPILRVSVWTFSDKRGCPAAPLF